MGSTCLSGRVLTSDARSIVAAQGLPSTAFTHSETLYTEALANECSRVAACLADFRRRAHTSHVPLNPPATALRDWGGAAWDGSAMSTATTLNVGTRIRSFALRIRYLPSLPAAVHKAPLKYLAVIALTAMVLGACPQGNPIGPTGSVSVATTTSGDDLPRSASSSPEVFTPSSRPIQQTRSRLHRGMARWSA